MREWTEADEDRYRASERARKTALIDKIEKDARKRYEQAEENYQSAGSLSSYRSMEKWRDLLDVCSMARESMEQSCYRCEQRYKNGKSIAEMLRQRKACGVESISIDEAIEQVRNAAS
jgi:hypothetical protein